MGSRIKIIGVLAIKSRLALILLCLSSLVPPFLPQASSAATCSPQVYNRCMYTGYYSGVGSLPNGILPLDNHFEYWDTTAADTTNFWAFPSSCTNQAAIDAAAAAGQKYPACVPVANYAEVFIGTLHDYIFNDNYTCSEPGGPTDTPYPSCAATRRDAIGASAIINTMMNQQGPSFQASTIQQSYINGVNRARDLFSVWSQLVRAYDSRGLVRWNYKTFEPPNHLNSSSYQHSQDSGFFINPNTYPDAEIIFTKPGGAPIYQINRRCGNISGIINPLPDFNVQGLLQSGPGTPPGGTASSPGGPLQSNNPYVIRAGAWNAGPGQAAVQTYTLTIPAGVTPAAPYAGGSWNPAARTVTWTNILLNGAGMSGAVYKDLGFAVDPSTFNGTKLTFSLTVGPHDFTGAAAPAVTLTYVVEDPRYPSFRGLSGDIHAGGACGTTSGHSNISANPKGTSYGEYVVTSSGITGGVESNAGLPGKSLSASNYANICRPDLLAVANAARTADSPTLNPATSGGRASRSSTISVDLGTITGPGKPDVYYFDGAVLNLSGTIHSKLTIVTAGDIHITGNIQLDNSPVAARYVPSLGLLATGDISIDPIVTRVDAYLFSDGAIDTCAAHSSACATPILYINGFMMGKSLSLNRLGPLNSKGDQIAEQVTLTPQLYLNPPRFFNAAGDSDPLQSGGERQPLF